jgi:hypothetical protein
MELMRKLIVVLLLLSSALFAQDFDTAGEARLLDLVNQERARAGLPSVKADERLTAAARQHSELLAQHKALSHQFDNEPPLTKRLTAKFLRFDRDGENVAFDTELQTAHEGLMNSPPHRANILDPKFNAIGIGIVRSGEYLWITQDFIHRLPQLSEQDAVDNAAAAFDELRRKAGSPRARLTRVPQLHDLACQMAAKDKLDTGRALSLPGASSAVAYTESDPGRLPASAHRLAGDRNMGSYAVGACFRDSPHYPAGTFWVLLVTY